MICKNKNIDYNIGIAYNKNERRGLLRLFFCLTKIYNAFWYARAWNEKFFLL